MRTLAAFLLSPLYLAVVLLVSPLAAAARVLSPPE